MTSERPEPGSELRKRMSPEFARRERRRNLWAGLVGLGMGLAVLVFGVDSVRTGEWVEFGRAGDAWAVPGFVAILMALFILFISASVIWRFARKT